MVFNWILYYLLYYYYGINAFLYPRILSDSIFRKMANLDMALTVGEKSINGVSNSSIWATDENINHESPKDYFLIDCSYIRCLLMYGLTHFIFLMSAHTIIQKKLIQQKFHIFAFMLMLIAIHSTMEILLLDIAYNVFILMLFAKIDIPSLE